MKTTFNFTIVFEEIENLEKNFSIKFQVFTNKILSPSILIPFNTHATANAQK